MKICYVILLLALLSWKGYQALRRGVRTYRGDRSDHASLREYLLGNGATVREALFPFVRHALPRAFLPLFRHWHFWAVVAGLSLFTAIFMGLGRSLLLSVVCTAVVLTVALISLLAAIVWYERRREC